MTTLHFELDDKLHRRAKMRAAAEGIPLKQWVTRAIEHELAATKGQGEDDEQ
ncbi:MAG: toxin-antitoxin system HicB family antitoxin [bacterium]